MQDRRSRSASQIYKIRADLQYLSTGTTCSTSTHAGKRAHKFVCKEGNRRTGLKMNQYGIGDIGPTYTIVLRVQVDEVPQILSTCPKVPGY